MTDRRTVQLVIASLAIFALAGLAGIVYLIGTGHKAEDVSPLVALTGPAIGAVGAMLVSTRSVDVEGLQQLADAQQPPPPPQPGPPAFGPPPAPDEPA